MNDRQQADTLSRKLVENNAYRKVDGMVHSVACGKLWGPNLLHEATASILAMQAMERGVEIVCLSDRGTWWARIPGHHTGEEGPLGIVVAMVLLALAGTPAKT